jgi:hypothetical protein
MGDDVLGKAVRNAPLHVRLLVVLFGLFFVIIALLVYPFLWVGNAVGRRSGLVGDAPGRSSVRRLRCWNCASDVSVYKGNALAFCINCDSVSVVNGKKLYPMDPGCS